MNRTECFKYVASKITREAVVTNLGTNTVDFSSIKDRPENYYMRGGMGLTASTGVGIAIAQKDRKVIVLDGDGSALMNMGAIPLIGDQAPKNLVYVVVDNQMWLETGGQQTMTGRKTDLEGVARACGIAKTATVRNIEAFQDTFSAALKEDGPWVIIAKVDQSNKSGTRMNLPPQVNVFRFVEAMGK